MTAIQRLILFGAIVLFLGPSATAICAAPAITWEVENRFRFYKRTETFRAYLKTAQEVRAGGINDWISRTERKLQSDHVARSGGWNGWASSSLDDTCWDRSGHVLINRDRCEDYTLPASHRILLSVSGIDAGATCTAKSESFNVQPAVQAAAQRRRLLFNQRQKEIESRQSNVACNDIPIEVPFSVDGKTGATVTVLVQQSGAATTLEPVKIVVKDLLVVGMGDSFAAGVGNPDRPAQLRSDIGASYDGGASYLPLRRGGLTDEPVASTAGAGSRWLDVRCFRSQYGPQFRTALHLAADLPHAAVTFYDLACDGARIIEGLLHRKELDSGFGEEVDDPESQIGRASQLLCSVRRYRTVSYRLRFAATAARCPAQRNGEICEFGDRDYQREAIDRTSMRVCAGSGPEAFQRKIDVLLLSIGGNDIGFSPMVGYVLLSDAGIVKRFLRYLATEIGFIHSAKIGEDRLQFLRDKYRVLDQAIDRHLPLRTGTSKPVFLSAYPLPVDDRDGNLCGSSSSSASASRHAVDGDRDFDRFAGSPPGALARLKDVARTSCLLNIRRMAWFHGGSEANAVLNALTAPNEDCAGLADQASSSDVKIDWQFDFAMLGKWQGHGFCAVRAQDDERSVLSLPRFESRNGAPTWTPLLENLRPYESRQRWLRTPNDAFATTNWHTYSPRIGDPANLLAASTTTAMHPTAEGYAAMADSLRSRVARFMCSERGEEFGSEPLCLP